MSSVVKNAVETISYTGEKRESTKVQVSTSPPTYSLVKSDSQVRISYRNTRGNVFRFDRARSCWTRPCLLSFYRSIKAYFRAQSFPRAMGWKRKPVNCELDSSIYFRVRLRAAIDPLMKAFYRLLPSVAYCVQSLLPLATKE